MGSLRRPHVWVLLLAGVICLLTFQGRRVLTEHEVFAAEPAREMLQGHGLLLQPFAGEYRTKKPPGQSWLIATSLAVTRSQAEWAARLPSALAGVGLAVVAGLIAARLGTGRQGLVAGLMTLTCVGVQQRARLAEADMALALCVGAAQLLLVRSACATRDEANAVASRHGASRGFLGSARKVEESTARAVASGNRFWVPALAFWFCVAFGFLIKGPVVLGFTVLPALVAWGVLRFGTKNPRAATTVRRTAFWWPAVVGGVVLIAGWVGLALHEYPAAWDQWVHELSRVTGDVGHGDEQRHDPVYAYFWLLPQSTLPWCLFAPFGVAAAWRRRRRPANVLLTVWGVGGFVLVSLSAFKVLHYILPTVVPTLVLAAVGFDRLLDAWLRGRPASRRAAWERAALAGWFGVAAVVWLVVAAVVMPSKDWGRKVKAFARQVDAAVPPGEPVYFFRSATRSGEDQTAWYLHRPLRQTAAAPDARPAYVMCGAADVATLAKAATVTPLLKADPVSTKSGDDRNDRVLVRVD